MKVLISISVTFGMLFSGLLFTKNLVEVRQCKQELDFYSTKVNNALKKEEEPTSVLPNYIHYKEIMKFDEDGVKVEILPNDNNFFEYRLSKIITLPFFNSRTEIKNKYYCYMLE